MLLEPGYEASLGLSDVDLSTRAWYLVHDVRLLLDGERVFDLSKHGPESRARPKHHFDVVIPARLSDPLTNACYIRQHHQRGLVISIYIIYLEATLSGVRSKMFLASRLQCFPSAKNLTMSKWLYL